MVSGNRIPTTPRLVEHGGGDASPEQSELPSQVCGIQLHGWLVPIRDARHRSDGSVFDRDEEAIRAKHVSERRNQPDRILREVREAMTEPVDEYASQSSSGIRELVSTYDSHHACPPWCPCVVRSPTLPGEQGPGHAVGAGCLPGGSACMDDPPPRMRRDLGRRASVAMPQPAVRGRW